MSSQYNRLNRTNGWSSPNINSNLTLNSAPKSNINSILKQNSGSNINNDSQDNNVAENFDKNMYDYTDPRKVGRGVWFMFLLMSAHAETRNKRLWVCDQIRLFCKYFKCKECHGHCVQYIENNPPEDHIEATYGLFNWVSDFMSEVNVRLGKKPYDKNILFDIFTDEEYMVCGSDCTKSHDSDDHGPTNDVIPYKKSSTSFNRAKSSNVRSNKVKLNNQQLNSDTITIHHKNKDDYITEINNAMPGVFGIPNRRVKSRENFGFHLVKTNF